jgi:sterol desaturase/sphingolipid hydroxylase (fatty acid hydroxylase superfamily)
MNVLTIETVVVGLVVGAVSIAVGLAVEWAWPATDASQARPLFNLTLLAPTTILGALTAPLFAILTTLGVKALGCGLLVLPSRGWGLIAGAAVYFLTMDGLEYAFHRAQHKIPALWAMHSLHHSDSAFNISTTVRHFWADTLIKSGTIYLLAALMFRVDGRILGIYWCMSFYNYFVHMNVRVGFGRFSWLLNAPQYHRLHHSRRAGDEGCNFAAHLPLFDVLCGAYRRPMPGDYPPTGLESGPTPSNLMDALTWPLHTHAAGRLEDPAS